MSTLLRSVGLVFAIALVVGGFAGCLGGGENDAKETADAARQALSFETRNVMEGIANAVKLQSELHFETNVTIHVVFAGTPEEMYDFERLAAEMPPYFSPQLAFDNGPNETGYRSPLLYRFQFEFHRAPDEFGRDLFAYADSIAEETAPTAFLSRYDDNYEKRLTDGEAVKLFDGPKVEQWIAGNRSKYGLEFADPENTLFVLDSYTEKWWPHDTYYWYKYDEVIAASDNSRTMRAWGGTTDLLLYDISAAPNDSGDDKSAPCDLFPINWANPQAHPDGTAFHDPPVWHYEGSTATMGTGPAYQEIEAEELAGDGTGVCVGTQRTIDATTILSSNIRSAAHMRFFPTYLYPPLYKPVYQINLHLYHDGVSIVPKTLEDYADLDLMMSGLRQQIPWAEIRGSLKTYVLPDDDPGMNQALTTAKAHGAGTYIPAGPVMNYIDANPDKFIDPSADVFNVKAFFFILQGHFTFYLPAIVGGVALGDVDGQAWGTISNINDGSYLRGSRPADAFLGINLHEIGHFFGLRHPHDGDAVTPDGEYYNITTDFTWGSIASALSYRIRSFTSDDQDRDSIARAHFYQNVRAALRESETAYRLLDDSGVTTTPASVGAKLIASEEATNTAIRLFEQGQWIDSVYAALDAAKLAREARDAAGEAPLVEELVAAWSATGVDSAGVKGYAVGWTASVTTPPGAYYDYMEITLPAEVESVRVRVSFTNSPTGWGDLFVGWNLAEPIPPLIAFAEGNMVQLAPFGVHDAVDETPATGATVLEHTIHVDRFPLLRAMGSLLVGAGAMGPAQDAAYDVEVYATYRQWSADASPGLLVEGQSAAAAASMGTIARDEPVDPFAVPDLVAAPQLDGHSHHHG